MKSEFRIQRRAVAVACGLLSLSSAAAAQISFQAPIAYPSGSDPRGVALADFDGDGDVDIAVTVHNPARLALLRNTGAGAFLAPELTTLIAGTDPVGMVARDFNLDGHVDLMLANSATNGVRFLRNLGDGHFVSGEGLVVDDDPQNIAAADFDLDGDYDVAVTCRGDDTVKFIRNEGLGHFVVAQTLAAGDSPRGLAFGRLSAVPSLGAAPLDLAVVAHGSRQVRLYRGQGNGTFVASGVLTLGGIERPESIAIADVDNDGDDDLLVTLADTTVHDIGVFRQLSPGVFCQCDYFDVGGVHPVGLVVGDFDFDTYIDAAAVNSVTSSLSVLRNLAGQQFGELQTFPVLGPDAMALAAADLDGNHYLDLVVTNDGGNSVSVILNGRDNPSNYCLSSPNSAGSGAHMGWSGMPSVSAGSFALAVSGAPASVNGLFFIGETPTQVPYSSGYLCIAPPVARLGPALMTSSTGSASRLLDFNVWPTSVIDAGSVWNAQFWYRDPLSGSGGTNFSDGLRVVFEP